MKHVTNVKRKKVSMLEGNGKGAHLVCILMKASDYVHVHIYVVCAYRIIPIIVHPGNKKLKTWSIHSGPKLEIERK